MYFPYEILFLFHLGNKAKLIVKRSKIINIYSKISYCGCLDFLVMI